MITEHFYDTKMVEAFKLLGTFSKANAEMARAIYSRIKANYTDDDLSNALESIMQSDMPKINFPILLRCLNLKRSLRFEEQAKRDKETGEDVAKRFWNMETRDNCTTHNCMTCPYRAGRCDTVAHHTLNAIKLMSKRQWRTMRKDELFEDCYREVRQEQREYNRQILSELDRQFPGVGFSMNYDLLKKQVYTCDELKNFHTGRPVSIPVRNEPAQGSFIPELPDA